MEALVRTNLEHYVLWSQVQTHSVEAEGLSHVLSGFPPQKLSSDDEDDQIEWVVPHGIAQRNTITIQQINSWFTGIERISGSRPKRVTVALVNDDSTVVYYFVHDGIVKPKN